MDEPYVEVIVLVIDQETFDAALGEFLDEVTQVLALFPLKAPGVDFGAELQQIQGAKAKLDAALEAAKDPAPAPVEAPPVEASADPVPVDPVPVEVPPADPAPAPDAPVDASAPADAPAPDAAPPADPSFG